MIVLAAAVILSCSGAVYDNKEHKPLQIQQMSMVVDFQAGTLEMLKYKMRARTVSDTAELQRRCRTAGVDEQ